MTESTTTRGRPRWFWWAIGLGGCAVLAVIVVVALVVAFVVLPGRGGGPHWATPELDAEWTVEQEDDTTFRAVHTDGCFVETRSMPLVGADSSADDDTAASEADLTAYVESQNAEAASVLVEPADPVSVPGPEGSTEFSTAYATIETDDGEMQLEVWYWRSFVDEGVSLSGRLSCAAGELKQTLLDSSLNTFRLE